MSKLTIVSSAILLGCSAVVGGAAYHFTFGGGEDTSEILTITHIAWVYDFAGEQELVDASDAILIGTILRSEPGKDEMFGSEEVSLQVQRVVSGPVQRGETIALRKEKYVFDDPPYPVGQRVFLFLMHLEPFGGRRNEWTVLNPQGRYILSDGYAIPIVSEIPTDFSPVFPQQLESDLIAHVLTQVAHDG